MRERLYEELIPISAHLDIHTRCITWNYFKKRDSENRSRCRPFGTTWDFVSLSTGGHGELGILFDVLADPLAGLLRDFLLLVDLNLSRRAQPRVPNLPDPTAAATAEGAPTPAVGTPAVMATSTPKPNDQEVGTPRPGRR